MLPKFILSFQKGRRNWQEASSPPEQTGLEKVLHLFPIGIQMWAGPRVGVPEAKRCRPSPSHLHPTVRPSREALGEQDCAHTHTHTCVPLALVSPTRNFLCELSPGQLQPGHDGGAACSHAPTPGGLSGPWGFPLHLGLGWGGAQKQKQKGWMVAFLRSLKNECISLFPPK